MASCNISKIITGVLTAFLGSGILISYVPVVRGQLSGKDYWFGMGGPKPLLYTLQLFAALGFLAHLFSFLIRDDNSDGEHIGIPIIYLVLLVSALLWGLFVVNPTISKGWVSLVLIITGLASLALLGMEIGYFKKDNPHRIYSIVGIVFLCIVTVFVDAISWNVNYLRG